MNEIVINQRIGENVRKYRKLYSATKEELPQRKLASRIGTSSEPYVIEYNNRTLLINCLKN